MVLIVKHSVAAKSISNPNVEVDGPAWNANHSIVGTLPPSQGGAQGFLESFSGANSTAQLQTAIGLGVLYVQLSQDITLTAQCDLPANFTLECNRFLINQGANVTTLFTLAEGSQIQNGRLNGNGTIFTGDMIQINAGNNQRLVNVDVVNTQGYNLNFAANFGGNFAWIGGSFNRTTFTNNAILLPASELGTTGPRDFVNLNGNGSWMIDLNGGNFTRIFGGSMLSLSFRPATHYCKIVGTRIASSPNIDGTFGEINAIFDAGVTIAPGAQNNTIWAQPGLTITDSSGNATNQIIPAASNTWTQYMAGGNTVGWELRQAGSAALAFGTDGSNNPYIRSRNSLPISFGINTTDYFTLAADGGLIAVGQSSKGANTVNAANLFVKGASVGVILGGYAIGVNLNSIADTAITIASPYTNYRVQAVLVQNTGTTASLTAAQFGVFSTTGGGGTALINTATALSGITSNVANTSGNEAVFNSNAAVWSFSTVQFRVTQGQGASATGNVYIFIQPLPSS